MFKVVLLINAGWTLVRTVAVTLLGGSVIVFGRPLIFLVICNDLRGLFGRSLVLVFALRECADGHHAEHRYHQKFSH